MKKNLYIGIAALAALTLSACQKETKFNDEPNMVTVTLTADKAGDSTRAAAVEGDSKVTYEWTDEDIVNLKVFVVGQTEGDKPTETLTAVEGVTTSVSSDKRILSITATVAENSTLRAVVSSDWTTSATDPKPRQISKQYPTTDNFDPNADILVAEDVTVSGLDEAKLDFQRPVTVNKMTLKGLAAGETVTKVVLTSGNDLTGYFNYPDNAMSGQHKDVTMLYEDAAADANGQFPVYFVVMPSADNTLSLLVETTKNSKNYRYVLAEFGPVSFTKGKFVRFGVDLDGMGTEIVDENYTGEWVIGGTNGTTALAATAWSSGNFYPVSGVEISGEVVTVTGSADPFKMTVTRIAEGEYAGLYTIVDANGNYLTATGGTANNYLAGKTEPEAASYWSIAKTVNGDFDILAEKVEGSGARNSMRLNFGSPRVTCYDPATTSQPRVTLYPFSKVVVTTPPAAAFKTIAELNELVTSTSKTYSGSLTNAVVSFVPATNVAIIKDATGSITYYKSGHGVKQGQTFSGDITVSAVMYTSGSNALYSEITDIGEAKFTGDETTVEPEAVTLAALTGNYAKYQNAYVKVSGLSVTSVSGKNINVTDGTNNYVVYLNYGNATCKAGDVITAVGTVTKYGTTEEIKVWKADDLTVGSDTPKTVTFTQPTQAGCSIAVSVDGSAITSGATVASGKVVTLTATVGTGFAFGGWTVTGATVASASAATTTFTMGSTDVTVSAAFRDASSTVPDPETIVFADLNLDNGVQYSDPFDGGHFTITFGGGGNDGKYYTTGSGVRTYGGGTITVASTDYTITEIEFTWDGSNCPTEDNANPAGYDKDTKKWTGSAKSVVLTRPSGSGHWRLQSVKVTYGN